ncbi:eIF-2-alpha kinase GCN2-like [Dendronephthya gigantea]|uniref:eIF-2-alpha kinase GCN2-like n=1 Tax=Dendronephthya gigantea TaxID=151771 RepID=UPI00106AF05F|nr:eIF-2-alpha kinase GCN2-like [Dendronephthya gigantea]
MELSHDQNAPAQCRFNKIHILGRGAFGEVWKAQSEEDGKFYAIKIMPLSTEGGTKYHKRELELLTKLELSERNVIKYFKSWIMNVGSGRQMCIQMELCSVNLGDFIYFNNMGGAEIIKSEAPTLYQHVFPQILNGLDAIHSIYWVHRDIHIGNILIANHNPQGISDINVKIADFGLARYIETDFKMSANSLTVVPTFGKLSAGVGNELFRAPEQSSEEYDFKVDIYSSGIVFYLLKRYIPNRSQVDEEIKALRRNERHIEHLYHKGDQIFNNLITQLLHENPEERPTASKALACLRRGQAAVKKFLVKKYGEETWHRCSSDGDTLSSIKATIQNNPNIGIKADAQVLQQEMTIQNKERLVAITSDEVAREMFLSAETKGEKVMIIESDGKKQPL